MKHQLTKADIKKIAEIWEEKTVSQIAEVIGCREGAVYNVARVMRENGFKLAKKRTKGYLNGLILETLDEL